MPDLKSYGLYKHHPFEYCEEEKTTLPTAATRKAGEFGVLPPRLAVPFQPDSALLLKKA